MNVPTDEPTPDQAARTTITSDLDRTLFVEAGAGTGKTRKLVERIVELVLTGIDGAPVRLSEVAAITFTEAAAAELRDRIRLGFEAQLRAALQARNQVRARHCSQALEDADVAAISTLHSFAQRLLSEHPVEVGIPPQVDVVDEVQSQIEFEQRWSDFVDELFDDPDAEPFMVRAAILGAGIGGGHQHLRDLAHTYDDNWDRLGSVADAPVAAPLELGSVRHAIRALMARFGECADPDDPLLVRLEAERPVLERLLHSASETEQLRSLVRLSTFSVGNSGRAPSWADKQAVRAAVDSVREQADRSRARVAAETLELLSRRVARFTLDSADERRREGRLEFHDLLVLARKLLRESTPARQALSGRYRVLLLDEFQDTDPIQIELALLLAGSVGDRPPAEWQRIEPEPGRLFMVGDPKQSIYRFRRADIELFLDARARFESGQVSLTTNFRTVPEVVAAVNGLFAQVMPETTAAQPAYEPLHAHRVGSGRADHRPLVLGGPMEAPAGELRQAEADEVARIVDDIRENPHRWPVWDDDAEEWRAPRLRDVTILFPTRTSLRQLTSALSRREIAYRADTGTLVYETQEIRDLLAALRAIDDPSDEIAMVAALRSPLYGVGDDELWRFRQAGGRFDIRRDVPEVLEGTPIATAVAHLRELAADRWWYEPSRLLLRLVEDRRADVLALDGARARDTWRRIRYVVDQSRAFSEAGGGDLRAYLEWTSLQGADGSRAHEPMLPEADDDAVQIMTVHGSKGLEFPITIVSGLTTRMTTVSRPGVDVKWGEPGTMPEVRLTARNRTENFDARADLEAQMDRPEKDRLLYVAMTRARDHLVLSGFHNGAVDKAGMPKVDSHGRTVHEYAAGPGADLFRTVDQGDLFDTDDGSLRPASGDATASTPETLVSPEAGDPGHEPALVPSRPIDPAAWAAERRDHIERASAVGVLSATALARMPRDPGQAPAGSPVDEAPDPGLDALLAEDDAPGDDGDVEGALPPRPFRRGRAGTAIGSAVHAVLQLVDLAAPDDAVVEQLIVSQAWAEAVPEHRDTIAGAVRSALSADIVRSCRTNRHWKELFVAAPAGDITIEGYVDLLVETDEGLVVVDYKTDTVVTEGDVDAKLDTYALQGAAYAVAVETATGRPVVDVQFVFARPSGPVVRSVTDLEGLRRTVGRLAAMQ